jgi:hypothetical protein
LFGGHKKSVIKDVITLFFDFPSLVLGVGDSVPQPYANGARRLPAGTPRGPLVVFFMSRWSEKATRPQTEHSRVKVELERARISLESEIERRQLSGVRVVAEEDHIKLMLDFEDRTLWVGHVENKGYFLTFDLTETPPQYFALGAIPAGIARLLGPPPEITAVAPDAPNKTRDNASDKAARLLSAIVSDHPDAEDVRNILDELPTTDRGLDVLATLARLKKCRNSLEKLKSLLATHRALEAEYQSLLSSNPWMLGSQYTGVVGKEFLLWFRSRVDLILSNAVGYLEIVELKRPDMTLLVETSHEGVWRASKDLSDVLAQARSYVRALDENRKDIEERLGLAGQSMSRLYRSAVIIVAGRTPEQKAARDALRDFSATDPRLVVLTYDDLLAIGEATVTLFERRLDQRSRLALLGAHDGAS